MSAPVRAQSTLLTGRLSLDDDHELYRESVAGFLSRDVAPYYASWRIEGALPYEIFTTAADYGFFGTGVPENLGGAGVDDRRFSLIFIEECLRSGMSGLGLMAAMHNGVCIPFLRRFGDESHKQRWLPALASGRAIATVIDAAHLTLTRDSLTATLTGGPGTAGASLFLVSVEDGARVLIIDATESTVTKQPDTQGFIGVDEAPGITLELLGHNAAECEGGTTLVSSTNAWMAVIHAAAAQAALSLAVQYASERKVFGQPLTELENTKTVIGDAAAHTCAATDLAYRTAVEHDDHTGISARAAAARHVAASAHRRSVDLGLQLHGGYGYMREYPIAQAYADAAVLTSMPIVGARAEHAIASALGL